ncbi:hypothetical protein ACJX0J_012881, partial [Zea mays]
MQLKTQDLNDTIVTPKVCSMKCLQHPEVSICESLQAKELEAAQHKASTATSGTAENALLEAKSVTDLKSKDLEKKKSQPRRHLLTIGWSTFVNRKKLKSEVSDTHLR